MRSKKSGGVGRPLLGILFGAAGALTVGKVIRRHRYDLLSLLRRLRKDGRQSAACRRADGAVG